MSTAEVSPEELHLLYVLLDSNLPTGGFVSSSGLESWEKHGFLTTPAGYDSPYNARMPGQAAARQTPIQGIMDFAAAEMENYASTTMCFVADAWTSVRRALDEISDFEHPIDTPEAEGFVKRCIESIARLDDLHESCLLSHVSRRSSKAQGVAMLTLYGRGLGIPPVVVDIGDDLPHQDGGLEKARGRLGGKIVEQYKRLVRGGKSPGHLATCWGVITAALSLPLDRAMHLHLFLHARAILSSAVRLNVIGPYASSQLLLHPLRPIIEKTALRHRDATCGFPLPEEEGGGKAQDGLDVWEWTHDMEGPATTWLLGEILMARHDMQHSRIFNS